MCSSHGRMSLDRTVEELGGERAGREQKDL